MRRNNIDFAVKDSYAGASRVKECHFGHRYGPYQEFTAYMGGLRIPITNRKEEEEFINEVTRALAKIWRLNPPKKKQK